MTDKCHLCLLGLIILSSLLTGTSGVDDAHVFISSGENVRLPCNNTLHDCKSTTWNYYRHSAGVELFAYGKKKKDIKRHERLSLGSDCSLNIKNITKEDYGSYSCQQYVNDKQQGTDARVYLHVLYVSSSSSQTEISAGSSVTLYCQLHSSYTGVSCDDWIRSEGIQLFWVNQAGVKLKISESRYQESAPGHCISTVITTLLNEDDNREWRCEVTHRNQVKTSVTYTVKSSASISIVSRRSNTILEGIIIFIFQNGRDLEDLLGGVYQHLPPCQLSLLDPPLGMTAREIDTEPEPIESDQVREPATMPATVDVPVEHEGAEDSTAHCTAEAPLLTLSPPSVWWVCHGSASLHRRHGWRIPHLGLQPLSPGLQRSTNHGFDISQWPRSTSSTRLHHPSGLWSDTACPSLGLLTGSICSVLLSLPPPSSSTSVVCRSVFACRILCVTLDLRLSVSASDSSHTCLLTVTVIIVAAVFAVLLPALILWVICKKAGVRRATDDSVVQTDDVTYTEVTAYNKSQAKKNKVHCDDKVTYASIRGAEAGAQENCSTSGVDDAHVFISSGKNVRLPCNNALPDCKSATWIYNRHSAAVELIGDGIIIKDIERHERLSLGSDCSMNIKNITKRRLWILQLPTIFSLSSSSSSSSQTEISAGSSVTLSCQLYSYAGVSCDDWIRSEGIQLFWVNQAGVKPTISDSGYQISFLSGHCISTLTTTLLNEDDNREWRCEVTHRNQVKTSATYTVRNLVTMIIVEFAAFAAPTVILLQIICARKAEPDPAPIPIVEKEPEHAQESIPECQPSPESAPVQVNTETTQDLTPVLKYTQKPAPSCEFTPKYQSNP
ncbi:Contactin-3 [Labeo rohita]|uniref:Contactin-3 n=1 Tax=Labeo rohita TaxID=84645 RepID=A0ABQ8MW89_LABRO|nr:Contactin-3 [Labeo rohita]